MALKLRLVVAGLITGLGLSVLGVARHYSAPIITYVVEEALIQKLPTGTDSNLVRSRFHAMLGQIHDRKSRLERLLAMSQYLEKLQVLEPQDLDRLLAAGLDAFPEDRR